MKENRSLMIRVFNAIFSLIFIVSLVSVLFFGFEKFAIGLLALSVVSVATPVVLATEEGILDILIGIFEAFIEGVMAIVGCISDFISGN